MQPAIHRARALLKTARLVPALKTFRTSRAFSSGHVAAVKSEAVNDKPSPGNPVDTFRSHISSLLADVSGVKASQIYPSLSWTTTLDRGDLSFAVPRLGIKHEAPAQLANDLANRFPASPLIQKPEAVEASLRFFFRPDVLPSMILPLVFQQGQKYGLDPTFGLRDALDESQGRKSVLVEFSSPNIAKEFHVGHLRSTILGAFVANLHQAMGWDVVRMNYLGDWGRQFGLLAVGWERFGDEDAFELDPIGHLVDIYVRTNKLLGLDKGQPDTVANETNPDEQQLLNAARSFFQRMEAGEADAMALWQRFRDVSIQKYKESYARLGISFDEYSGESTVTQEVMSEVEHVLQSRNISFKKGGTVFINFRKHGAQDLNVAVLRNNNGTSNYLLRDIGAAIQRFRRIGMDEMIYVVMSEQEVHIQRLIKTLELMGGEYRLMANKMTHISFGKIHGMSTRKGDVKFLHDVLNDISAVTYEYMKRDSPKYAEIAEPLKTADILGISSLMAQDMRAKRIKSYNFNLERMLSFDGDTGLYLQYAHARLCSIQRKAGLERGELVKADFSLLTEKHAVDLVRLLAMYPDTIFNTYRGLEPTTLLVFLFRLTHQLSSSYDVLRVVDAAEGPETAMARAALFEAVRLVLSNGMRLLGMTPLERM